MIVHISIQDWLNRCPLRALHHFHFLFFLSQLNETMTVLIINRRRIAAVAAALFYYLETGTIIEVDAFLLPSSPLTMPYHHRIIEEQREASD